jgi:quaternary ammonium compound-resistance protein SugE
MAWIFLGIAGALEVVWAFAMKKSEGFTVLVPSLVTLLAMVASFGLLALAMRSLPLGTAYTIWTGIGALGAFVLGVAVLGEALTLHRVVAAGLILSGIVLMKLASPH